MFLSSLVIMAACADQGVEPQTRLFAADSADQFLQGMTTVITGDGIRRSVVSADTAYIYQSRQVAELRGVRVQFYNIQGTMTSILTSRYGHYEINRGTLEARGNVVFTMADGSGRRLTTEHLLYEPAMNQVRSDSAFVYDAPTGVLRGSSFTSDPDFRNIVTNRPRGRQRGEGVPLPGSP
jgi:LPS export ABC transporter protein LptC